jgi:hypothetical protein
MLSSAAGASGFTSGDEARDWWIERAENGGPNMQYGLGMMYATGNPALGIERDESRAAVWYLRAAEQGHVEAQFALGLLHEEGHGVKRDAQMSLFWYRQAAEQGHAIAKEKLRIAVMPAVTASVPVNEAAAGSPLDTVLVNRTNFWDWWQGALALGFITLAFWWVLRAPLGVSSSWDRIVHWRDEEEYARKEQAMFANKQQMTDAMLAETIAQFGKDAVAELLARQEDNAAKPAANPAERRQIPWQAHVTFLAMMMIGGLFASVMRGDFQIQFDMGAEYARLFGSGPHMWVLLLFGGMMVGFGTRMAGGCTSGHGLSGCSRLQPGSLVGTAAFFGTAVATSFILETLI